MRTGKVLGPTSAAFQHDQEDGGLSVYRDGLLNDVGRGPADVAERGRVNSLVAAFSDDILSECALTVDVRPTDEPEIGSAHALVLGWIGRTRSQVRGARRTLAQASICSHPGGVWANVPPPR